MRICVNKATNAIIEMQEYATAGTLINNAVNAGFAVAEIEEREVDQAGYEAAKAIDPNEINQLAELAAQEEIIKAKLAAIAAALPSRAQVKSAIDAAFPDAKQNAVITKLANVVYWLAKDSEL